MPRRRIIAALLVTCALLGSGCREVVRELVIRPPTATASPLPTAAPPPSRQVPTKAPTPVPPTPLPPELDPSFGRPEPMSFDEWTASCLEKYAPKEPTAAAEQLAVWESMLDRLEALGYYGTADPALVAEARAWTAEVWTLVTEVDPELPVRRAYRFDGEDLAEGMVADFLQEIAPFMATQGITLEVSSHWSLEPISHTVTVNGECYLMYGPEDVGENGTWYTESVRAQELVNGLLQRAGSRERFYVAAAGGNEGWGAFLTPEMYQAVAESQALPACDMLYILREEDLFVPRREGGPTSW